MHQQQKKQIINRGCSATGLSQMQLQKSTEKHQKIPKSVMVQHKVRAP